MLITKQLEEKKILTLTLARKPNLYIGVLVSIESQYTQHISSSTDMYWWYDNNWRELRSGEQLHHKSYGFRPTFGDNAHSSKYKRCTFMLNQSKQLTIWGVVIPSWSKRSPCHKDRMIPFFFKFCPIFSKAQLVKKIYINSFLKKEIQSVWWCKEAVD